MSNKIMIDQIAFDEAELKVYARLKECGELMGWDSEERRGCISAARSIINSMRILLFNTTKSTIKEENKNE